MDRFMPIRRHLLVLAGLLALLAAPCLLRAEIKEPQLASARARELWLRGSDQVLSGDFANALPTLEKIKQFEPGNDEIDTVISWLRKAQELEASRERLRERTYEYYVNKALKTAEEARAYDSAIAAGLDPPVDSDSDNADREAELTVSGDDDEAAKPGEESDSPKEPRSAEDESGYKWSRALNYCLGAKMNAADEEAFQREPWLKEIVDHVLEEIDRRKSKNEWSDALALNGFLKEIFPNDATYKENHRFLAKRAHLEFIYGPKTQWRKNLREVTAAAIPQILDRIEEDYVEETDLKKLCLEGIDQLIILAQAESLSRTFSTLSDKDVVSHFVTRLNGLRRTRVDNRPALRARDVTAVFNRVLVANKESGLNLPEAVLVDEFVTGMLDPLDEFTSVIWPAEVEEFNKHTRGEFVGVGIQITQDIGKFIRVETPLEDSPAYKAGIKPGDFIIAVDGKSTKDMTITQAVSEITGEAGTRVTLTIEDGVTQEVRDYSLVREQIKLRTVRGHRRDDTRPTGWDYMIEPDARIGYVRVSGFMEKTVTDLERAIEQLRSEGAQGMILDLRFNPGGLLTSAVKMSELFLGRDEPIVKTKGRSRQQNMEITSKNDHKFGGMPLIVLVNEYSASASEIVAGAVAGLKEACIIGTRTFGKGSVQNLVPIADNRAYLKLTTAYYYVYDADLPEEPWYCLHKRTGADQWGVEPHVVIKVIPQEQSKILRLRRERDLLKGKDGGEIPKEVLERRPTSQPDEPLPVDENPDVDPQLEAALNIMRIKLLSRQPWAMPPREIRALSRSNSMVKEPVSP